MKIWIALSLQEVVPQRLLFCCRQHEQSVIIPMMDVVVIHITKPSQFILTEPGQIVRNVMLITQMSRCDLEAGQQTKAWSQSCINLQIRNIWSMYSVWMWSGNHIYYKLMWQRKQMMVTNKFNIPEVLYHGTSAPCYGDMMLMGELWGWDNTQLKM